jgi:hypothetical protein
MRKFSLGKKNSRISMLFFSASIAMIENLDGETQDGVVHI